MLIDLYIDKLISYYSSIFQGIFFPDNSSTATVYMSGNVILDNFSRPSLVDGFYIDATF